MVIPSRSKFLERFERDLHVLASKLNFGRDELASALLPLVEPVDEHTFDLLCDRNMVSEDDIVDAITQSSRYIALYGQRVNHSDAALRFKIRACLRSSRHDQTIDRLTQSVHSAKEPIIAVSGAGYVIGIIAFNLHCLWQGLGFVSASIVQYTVAALGFYFFASVTTLALAIDSWAFKWLKNVVGSSYSKKKINYISLASSFSVPCVYVGLLFWGLNLPIDNQSLALGLAFWLSMSFSLWYYECYWVARTDWPSSMLIDKWWKMATGAYKILILVGLAFYSRLVFEFLPQELGGGMPRLCYIDVDKSKASEWILSELAGENLSFDERDRRLSAAKILRVDNSRSQKEIMNSLPDGTPSSLEKSLSNAVKTIHSRELEMCFDGGDYVIVRRHISDFDERLSQREVKSLVEKYSNNLLKRDPTEEEETKMVDEFSLALGGFTPKAIKIYKTTIHSISFHNVSWADMRTRRSNPTKIVGRDKALEDLSRFLRTKGLVESVLNPIRQRLDSGNPL